MRSRISTLMPAMRTVSSRYLHTQCYDDNDLFARTINFLAVAPSLPKAQKVSSPNCQIMHPHPHQTPTFPANQPLSIQCLNWSKCAKTASKDGKNILGEFEVELYFRLTSAFYFICYTQLQTLQRALSTVLTEKNFR